MFFAKGYPLPSASADFRVGTSARPAYLVCVVRFLRDAGIWQFIDIGSGLPSSPNVHEVAQADHTGARVVYVYNDPVVFSHAEALMADNDATTVAARGRRSGSERRPGLSLRRGRCRLARGLFQQPGQAAVGQGLAAGLAGGAILKRRVGEGHLFDGVAAGRAFLARPAVHAQAALLLALQVGGG